MSGNTNSDFNRTNYQHKEQIIRCGISSLKCLDGEDLNQGNRRRLQQLQQRDWIEQQIREKEERKRQEEEEKKAFEQQTLHINMMRGDLEDKLNQKRRNWEKNTKEFNVQQRNEKLDYERSSHLDNQAQNQYHITYCNTNNFQTENTGTCTSAFGPHRVIPYHWKGMNPQQKKDIILEQDQQRHERDILKNLERDEDKAFSNQTEHNRFMLINLERQKNRQHRQRMDEIKEFNLLAAKEQKIKLKHMYD
ncbi:hypothetical protein ABPG74_008923 [Tetrahymena malaccensis]